MTFGGSTKPMTEAELAWMRNRVEDRTTVGKEEKLLATIAAKDAEIARLQRHVAILEQHKEAAANHGRELFTRVAQLEAALLKAKTYVDECFKHEHYSDGVTILLGQLLGAQQTIDAALVGSST